MMTPPPSLVIVPTCSLCWGTFSPCTAVEVWGVERLGGPLCVCVEVRGVERLGGPLCVCVWKGIRIIKKWPVLDLEEVWWLPLFDGISTI